MWDLSVKQAFSHLAFQSHETGMEYAGNWILTVHSALHYRQFYSNYSFQESN
jgi:hypothetical protein